ncbi:histidine phosphatase family protein [Saccharibacillus alkalitolerans]|uniref:Histidine phosphatase family protein n=1 Tax=Saccharibacillus alkalitolerans TaxID=2705290 RepID=A0ABX0F5D9_9BACL|nr:histidine phosphatase family protein [Saccharibacillus alkalitolerans]NGZ75625.1 histidine phosphatase family protein [Saccharibacillus alkalitolerans]
MSGLPHSEPCVPAALLQEKSPRTGPSEETRLYFVRHAHSAYVHGMELERGLSAEGTTDAEAVRRRLEGEGVGVFVSSPYRRAIDTIRPLADSAGIAVEIHDDLRERLVSGSRDIGADRFLEEKQRCYEDFDYRPPGGESGREARKRASAVLLELLRRYPGERIAVGTHGDILTLMLGGFDERYGFDFWRRLSMPDIYCASFEGGKFAGARRMEFR